MKEGQHPSERMIIGPETYRARHAQMYDIHDEIHMHKNKKGKLVGLDVTPARRPRDFAEALEEGFLLDNVNGATPRLPHHLVHVLPFLGEAHLA